MKLTTLVATLVLGTSAGALAAPDPSPPTEAPRRFRHSWVALSEPFALTKEWRPIDVTESGTFRRVRLQTTYGATQLHRVIVQFDNGTRQIVDLDQRLDVGAPMVEIPLDHRRIDRVVVVGESHRNAAIQVFGI